MSLYFTELKLIMADGLPLLNLIELRFFRAYPHLKQHIVFHCVYLFVRYLSCYCYLVEERSRRAALFWAASPRLILSNFSVIDLS